MPSTNGWKYFLSYCTVHQFCLFWDKIAHFQHHSLSVHFYNCPRQLPGWMSPSKSWITFQPPSHLQMHTTRYYAKLWSCSLDIPSLKISIVPQNYDFLGSHSRNIEGLARKAFPSHNLQNTRLKRFHNVLIFSVVYCLWKIKCLGFQRDWLTYSEEPESIYFRGQLDQLSK